MSLRLFGVSLLFFSPVAALAAEVMFEGYYKISLSGVHSGYAIVRFEFEEKSKEFRQISFTRLKIGDKIMQESLKASTNDKLQPLNYQYTLQDGDTLKTLDATFKGDIMDLKILEPKKKPRLEKYKNPKNTFLASFLTYLMLQKPLPVNQAFSYNAVAEEEGGSYAGKALIESKETQKDFDILKVVNSYKGDKFISRLAVVKDPKDPSKNIKGEMLTTISPVKGVSMELVASPALATEGQIVPNKVLITLFGSMPTGKSNLLNKESSAPPSGAPKAPTAPSDQEP